MSSQIIKSHKGKPLVSVDTGLVTGLLPAVLDEVEKPEIKWNGRKIPGKLLLKTVALSRYVHKTYGGEVQWRLAYHREKQKWAVIVLSQFVGEGLYSQDCATEQEIEDELASLGPGWVLDGTGHSHETASAFKSGTDHKDEINQTGFHYTVGHVNGEKFDIHCRRSFRGVMYDNIDPMEMFTITSFSTKNLPKFPPKWTRKLKKRPVQERIAFNDARRHRNFVTDYMINYHNNTSPQFGFGNHKDGMQPTMKIVNPDADYCMGRPMYETIRSVISIISGVSFEDALDEIIRHHEMETSYSRRGRRSDPFEVCEDEFWPIHEYGTDLY